MKKILKKYWFVISIILLCIIKQLIAASLPIFARDAQGPDQYKLLVDAENIFNGLYIENNVYDIFTLFKRAISFPIFLALCHWLGIPYMAGYTLLYTLSCLIALYAFMQISKNKVLHVIAFAIMLFCPFSYDYIVQMVYNLSFTAPIAIAAISCLFLAYFKRNESNGVVFGWNLLAALNLSAIWLNREDSIWIVPLISCFILVVGISEFSNWRKNKKLYKLIIFLIPAFIVILSDATLSCINYKKFGIYTTNDYTTTNFERAYNSILKVEQDYFPEKCSIAKGTLEKIYVVSPALNELKPYMDEFYELGSYDKGGVIDDGEIDDALMNIALRDAASKCGYYKDAITANEFWGKVSEEIEEAFDNGLLQSRSMAFFGSTLHHPWRSNAGYASKWIHAATELMIDDVKHTLAGPQLVYNYVEKEVTDRYESITLDYSVDPPKSVITLAGWLYLTDGTEDYSLQLVDGNGNVISELEWRESPDIANEFIAHTSNCRFSIKTELGSIEDVWIRINMQDGSHQDILCTNDKSYEGVAYYFDVIDRSIKTDADEAYALQRIAKATRITNLYKFFSPFLIILFGIGYIYKTFKCLSALKNKNYVYFDAWILQSAVLGCILIFILALSFVHAFMWGALFYTHTIGVLLDFAGAAFVALDGEIICKKIGRKQRNRESTNR